VALVRQRQAEAEQEAAEYAKEYGFEWDPCPDPWFEPPPRPNFTMSLATMDGVKYGDGLEGGWSPDDVNEVVERGPGYFDAFLNDEDFPAPMASPWGKLTRVVLVTPENPLSLRPGTRNIEVHTCRRIMSPDEARARLADRHNVSIHPDHPVLDSDGHYLRRLHVEICALPLRAIHCNGYAHSGPKYLGGIPSEIGVGPLVDTLVVIELSHRNLRGEVPESLTRLRRLETLKLENNGLSGPLPPQMGPPCQPRLRKVILAFNPGLCGKLPPGLARLPDAHRCRLDVHGTDITWSHLAPIPYLIP
jgi:hypothetical protein